MALSFFNDTPLWSCILDGNGEPGKEQEVQPSLRRRSHTGPDQDKTQSAKEVPVRLSPSEGCWRVESGFTGVNKFTGWQGTGILPEFTFTLLQCFDV